MYANSIETSITYLQRARLVLQGEESQLAEHSPHHYSTRHAHLFACRVLLPVGQLVDVLLL